MPAATASVSKMFLLESARISLDACNLEVVFLNLVWYFLVSDPSLPSCAVRSDFCLASFNARISARSDLQIKIPRVQSNMPEVSLV